MAGRKNGIHWPILIGGIPMTLIGLIALLLAGAQIVNHLRALAWPEHPATLEELYAAAAPRHNTALSSRASRQEGRYRYRIADRDYTGERLSFSIIYSTDFDDWAEHVSASLGQPGNAITIRVNPADPTDSVAILDIRWAEIGVTLLFALGMGGGGLMLLAIARANGRRPLIRQENSKPAPVRGRTVFAMWLFAPIFALLAWLLWRDGHGIWAGCAALQPLLTLNASLHYARQKLAGR